MDKDLGWEKWDEPFVADPCTAFIKEQQEQAYKDTEWYAKLQHYRSTVECEFQKEWSKKKCKWFFKKHRQNKLLMQIYRRHQHPIFAIIEESVSEILPKYTNDFFETFADIKTEI
jgi:hypothetical protein